MCPAQTHWAPGPSMPQVCTRAFPGILGAGRIRGHQPQMRSLKGSAQGGLAGDLEEVSHKSPWLLEVKIPWGPEEVLLDEQDQTGGHHVLAFLGFPAPPREPWPRGSSLETGPCRKAYLLGVRALASSPFSPPRAPLSSTTW